MIGYVSFRGVSTSTLNLIVSKMPNHKKASVRNQKYQIPGRHGEFHVIDGYAAFDMSCTLMANNEDADIRQTINAWADGTGELYTSDDTGKVWIASVLNDVVYTRQAYNGKFFDTAIVTFRCNPVQHERIRSNKVFTESEQIYNIGTVEAYPTIIVTGNGTCSFSIGGKEVTIRGMQRNKPVTIDSDAGYVYNDNGAVEMIGEFPVIPLGQSNVILSDDTESLAITYNWGWL